MLSGWLTFSFKSFIEVKLEVVVSKKDCFGRRSNWSFASASITVSLAEAGNSTDHLTNASAKLSILESGIIYFGNIFFAEIAIKLKVDSHNAVHLSCNFEKVGLKVCNEGVGSAVISFVEAVSGDLKVEFVEAALLLDVEADLVEFAYWLEQVNEITAGQEAIELHDILVCSFSETVLGSDFAFILVKTATIPIRETTKSCHVVLDVRLVKLENNTLVNERESSCEGESERYG